MLGKRLKVDIVGFTYYHLPFAELLRAIDPERGSAFGAPTTDAYCSKLPTDARTPLSSTTVASKYCRRTEDAVLATAVHSLKTFSMSCLCVLIKTSLYA